MDENVLSDELKQFADAIETFGFDRFLVPYRSASSERQKLFYKELLQATLGQHPQQPPPAST